MLAQYQEVIRRPYDIVDHLETFVDTVHALKATKVIELGVRAGVSTLAWLYGLEGIGRLWSVDGARPVVDEFGFDLLGSFMDEDRSKSTLENWTFLLGWDNEPKVLAELPEIVDIVFIDTQHTYEVTLEELKLYVPRVRKGGRVLLHDTDLYETGNATTPQPPYPVRAAIADYCDGRKLPYSYAHYCNGLGTIYV